jgi:hypothetical protein
MPPACRLHGTIVTERLVYTDRSVGWQGFVSLEDLRRRGFLVDLEIWFRGRPRR